MKNKKQFFYDRIEFGVQKEISIKKEIAQKMQYIVCAIKKNLDNEKISIYLISYDIFNFWRKHPLQKIKNKKQNNKNLCILIKVRVCM